MSLDTIERINSFFETAVATPNQIYTIYEENNEDLRENNVGPFAKLFIEPSSDFTEGVGVTADLNKEEGVITAQLYVEKGEATKILYQYVTAIRDAFRYKTLQPETGEEGPIEFLEINNRRVGLIGKENQGYGRDSIQWFRIDVSIRYRKDYLVIKAQLLTWDSTQYTFDDTNITWDQTIIG